MDQQQTVRWSADSSAPVAGLGWGLFATGLSASPGVAALVFPFTGLASLSQGMVAGMVVLGVIVAGVPGAFTVFMVLNHREKRREVVEVRLGPAEVVVHRADGSYGAYPTSALTAIVVDREHWTDPVYFNTVVSEFRRLKLTFGDRVEQTRPGKAKDDESFGAALAALKVPIEQGVYVDYDTVG
ncbi:hypothetical protein [Paractinoplanes lichenicola]|uniref:Uncharacterized protein n=1 Tax=Paractinoplanes lichenicola TaxID=2802976 RepID=A0ABS1W076_9ACTN|nr:hypothetical protein [Actinoplanes lichenicola]MBL7260138.1 hypothetical protein [Actinoplanes lichenicola]